MFYAQKNYTDIQGINGKYHIADIGCFLTAFCNLEERFGKSIDPPTLNKIFRDRGIYIDVDDDVRDDLGWPSITAYDGQIHVTQTGGAGWPDSANAIVKFAYQSPRTGAATTHFCLVADPSQHTIIDSWDGVVRSPGYYGQPVAWAKYENVVPEPVVVPAAAVAPASTATSGDIITMQKGDTISAIALRYGLSAQDVLEHNGLSWADARNLPVGYQIRLPIAKAPAPADSGYKIEVLPESKPMHVSKSGGAEKWSFGNVKTWSDFKSVSHVPENTNVDIVAVANVIVGKDAAAYYMDKNALGDFATSGREAFSIGLSWKDLADGYYKAPDPAQPAPTPQPVETPRPVETPSVAPQTAPQPPQATNPPAAPEKPKTYKDSYSALPHGPTRFLVEPSPGSLTVIAKEFDNRRPPHSLHKNDILSIAGTFINGQTLYGLPTGAKKAGYWFGVPMDNLISETEVFDTSVDLKTKKVMGYPLSLPEQVTSLAAWAVATFTKLATVITKRK